MFDKFMNQNLILIKENGTKIEGIKASVQKKIYINDIELPIKEGDTFEFTSSSGEIQRLLVSNVVLYNVGSPLDHYEVEYKKLI